MRELKPDNRYSAFSRAWDVKAGVRNNPETYDLCLPASGAYDAEMRSWHLPTYSGVLQHPKLCGLTPAQQEYVKGTQLLEFVTKQTRFEVECVNWVASRLAHGKYSFELTEQLKLDALKIYTDEAYHAYYTQKIADQIRTFYGVDEEDMADCVEDFFEKIEAVFASFPPKHRSLSMLAFVIAGESQIVSDISEQMKGIVFEPIRAMFRDHMRDEVFHAHFFAKVFKLCWPQLSHEEKEIMGLSFCAAMELLGAPRTAIYYLSLAKLGYSSHDISGFIKDVYDNKEWLTTKVSARMQPTLDLLHQHGVFQISSVDNAFRNKGYF